MYYVTREWINGMYHREGLYSTFTLQLFYNKKIATYYSHFVYINFATALVIYYDMTIANQLTIWKHVLSLFLLTICSYGYGNNKWNSDLQVILWKVNATCRRR